MKKFLHALKESLDPPDITRLDQTVDMSVHGRRSREYPFADVRPRARFTDGYAELFVTPDTKQSELMIEANALAAARLVVRLEQKNTNQATATDLIDNLKRIEDVNARLRGRDPITPEEVKRLKNTDPRRDIGRVSLKERFVDTLNSLGWKTIAPAPQPEPAGEVHFTDFDARLVADNLEIGAKSLQEQARKSHIQFILNARTAKNRVSTEQTDIASGLGHEQKTAAVLRQAKARTYNAEALKLAEQAKFLDGKAVAMFALHDQLAMPPASEVNLPPRHIPLPPHGPNQ